MSGLIEVSLKKLALCPRTSLPILILESLDGARFLPVWVTYPEWAVLAQQPMQEVAQEPAFWPIVVGLLRTGEASVRDVSIEREGSRYAAWITIEDVQGERKLKTRAGEAIALAGKANAPIHARVDQLVVKECDIPVGTDGDGREWSDWLKQVRPEDFSESG